MKSAFMQYYATDVRNGTLEKLKKGKSPKKRPAKDKGRSSDKHRRTKAAAPPSVTANVAVISVIVAY
eukprot:scaffold126104_cov52-Cyclotella_meneghiniana.AAC.2